MARSVLFLKTQAATLDSKTRERLWNTSDPSHSVRHEASSIYNWRLISVNGTGTICKNNIQAFCEPCFAVWACLCRLAGCTAALNVSNMTEKQINITASLKCLLPQLGGITKANQLLQKKHMFSCVNNPDQSIIQSCSSGEIVHFGFHLFGSWCDWSLVDMWEEQGRKQINISSGADWI